MARIAGVNIPQNKLVRIGLTYIYGIGEKNSKDICKFLEIPNNIDVQETLQSLDKIVYYKNTSVLGRVWQGIKSLFA